MQLIIFTGVQASGKSSFYLLNLAHSHLRINLDMLKTRHRENMIFEACLASKTKMVIDNTNPTKADRARYIQRAKDAGFEVILVEDACAAATQQLHDAEIMIMNQIYCQIMSTEEVIDLISEEIEQLVAVQE